jgi:PAS domain S-box-containing protein
MTPLDHGNRQSAAASISRNFNPSSYRSMIPITELEKRPSRAPDYAAECSALLALGKELGASPDHILQKLAETTLTLCGAQSAGLSLLEPGGERFYWPAIAGAWADKVGGGTPRNYSPCGVVLDFNVSFLLSHPEVDFDYYASAIPVVEDCLLVPFYVNSKAVGTIWIVMHDLSRRLDSEDLRLMSDLGAFAAFAYQTLASLDKIHAAAAVIESSDDAIITKNLNSIITSWNAGAERVFGYTPQEAIGRPVTMLMPADQVDEEPKILERVRRGERIDHYETVRVHKDGGLLDISLTVSPIKDASGKIVGASNIARDVTERARASAQIKFLAREAEHRTKNILATVQATIHLTEAEDTAEFKKAVEGRIRALSNVHNLFVETRWQGAELRTLVAQELQPYRRGDGTRINIDGPELLLEPSVAQTMAVVLHELATNAAKYGPLSLDGGRVAITWTFGEDGRLLLSWAETGGPPVREPTRKGFGTRVMAGMIKQLKGHLSFDWRPEGMTCAVELTISTDMRRQEHGTHPVVRSSVEPIAVRGVDAHFQHMHRPLG